MVIRRTRFTDLLVPLSVVAIVGMMIFPLPSALLDVLLMINITLSLVLLLSAVYLSEPERFTSLPALLLLSTLFRLGLNISTTRQILSTAEAPEVVAAFGNFVVGGNLVVGLVIFSIVTLVQFLVVAKGAERVAEVAARFTLDAMPGQQMAIDSDVRAGIISLSDARERRLDLQRESKLYGALDGAMKFVKGDTIAGLFIALINMGAGLLIGISQYGLTLQVAFHRYTLFTIGDGLVSQIPALLTAVAAGVVVTRVSDKEGSFLGREVFSQLGREPQALGAASVLLLGLAFAPGLPMVPFLAMSGVLAALAQTQKTGNQRTQEANAGGEFRPQVSHGVSFRFSSEAALRLQQEASFPAAAKLFRQQIFEQTGVLVPEFFFELSADKMGCSADILLHGVCVGEVSLGQSAAFASDSATRREEKRREREVAKRGDLSKLLFEKLGMVLEKDLPELLDDTQTRMLLDLHTPVAEDLINSLVPKQIAVTNITTLLRQLVEERVSIRNLPLVLQAIAEFYAGPDESSRQSVAARKLSRSDARPSGLSLAADEELLASVRVKLRRVIQHRIGSRAEELCVYLLDAEVDHALSQIALAGSPRDTDFLEPLEEEARTLISALRSDPNTIVILTTRFARTTLRRCLQSIAPTIVVMAMEEVCPEVKVRVLGVFGEQAGKLLAGAASKEPAPTPRLGEVVPFERKVA